MLNKFEEEEYHVEEVFAQRQHEYDLVREKKKLNLQMKKDNVERVQRMQEYKRLNTLKKIEAVDEYVSYIIIVIFLFKKLIFRLYLIYIFL